jgi:hypothetical protein
MYHACGGEKMCLKFYSENVKGGDNLSDLGVDGMIILNWIAKK